MILDEQININALVGEFYELQEQWETEPTAFDWERLGSLARKGAHAYNEGAGPSFHALVLDGVCHTEFHERFLGYSVEAGFDPFMLAESGSGSSAKPVISHDSLAHASQGNEVSRRMRQALMAIAQQRFSRPLQAGDNNLSGPDVAKLFAILQACSESVPQEMLEAAGREMDQFR